MDRGSGAGSRGGMHATALLALINARHGTTFAIGERYAAGEQGAYAVVDPRGRRFVLKRGGAPSDYQTAAVVTERLRAVGYPAPRYCFVGSFGQEGYVIQEALPGAPPDALPRELLPRALELNRLQAGQAVAGPRDWPARVVDTVLRGGDGYCLLDPLRAYSSATAELLQRLQALVTAHADDECETGDVVHFDFQPANILVDRGTLSGVVDWEGTCPGDRTFDLATLLFYGYGDPVVRDRLWRAAREQARPGILGVYLAHLILRQVDWSIRHHGRATVARYLRRARRVLDDISSGATPADGR